MKSDVVQILINCPPVLGAPKESLVRRVPPNPFKPWTCFFFFLMFCLLCFRRGIYFHDPDSFRFAHMINESLWINQWITLFEKRKHRSLWKKFIKLVEISIQMFLKHSPKEKPQWCWQFRWLAAIFIKKKNINFIRIFLSGYALRTFE